MPKPRQWILRSDVSQARVALAAFFAILDPMPEPPLNTIAIVGAGAVGGYYGARLAQHGRAVHFLLRSDYAAVRQRGLIVHSADGDFTLPPDRLNVYDDPLKMPPADLVIIALKSTENHRFERLVSPLLHQQTILLTLQNGLGNEDDLARLFGAPRVLGGMAFTCINRIAPGEIDHSSHGLIRIGEFEHAVGGRSDRADRIAAMFNDSKVRCELVDDLIAARWAKLVWNIPFNGLGALLDATTDQLLASDAGARLVEAVMREVLAAAQAAGVRLSDDMPQQQIEATRSMGAYRTSTQLDRRFRRPMEIDAIFSRPLAAAEDAGLHLPHLRLLDFSLRMIDQAQKQPA
jgi:2-dehydropantoate 2-reductase